MISGTKTVVVVIAASLLICASVIFPQVNNQNQATIRGDRIIMLNGKPFFPIGMCFESQVHYSELRNNGFNFINLFSNNHFLYSDSCGFGSKNLISGDATTSVQYYQLLSQYGLDFRWDQNVQRIFNYIGSDNMYILGDDYTFYTDELNDYILNPGSCGDSIIYQQNFNQTIRNESVGRLVSISHWQGNKLIGSYSKDDANMFAVNGPYPTFYYDNFFNTRVINYKNTYDELKRGYPNSLVLMSLPNTFFPRAVDPQHWQNVDTAREHWIRDARLMFQGADVLFCPGYLTYENYSDPFMIYDNKLPSIYPYDLEKTVFGRVITGNKAVFGGLIFDGFENIPDTNDAKGLDKIKWHIYVGLQKGCTGLIFYGWHKYARPEAYKQRDAWKKIRIIINEMVNVLHLNDKVFVYTNSGESGHTISGYPSNNVSYAAYNVKGWDDYYLLVTNNPNNSLFSSEPDNMVSISCNKSLINWKNSRITEIFSNRIIPLANDSTINYEMPSYCTALFHVEAGVIPSAFRLYQCYPNPFNSSTKIKFDIPANPGNVPVNVNLVVYDLLGQKVVTLVNEDKASGSYEVEFNGSNFASGVYFYRLECPGFVDDKKSILLK